MIGPARAYRVSNQTRYRGSGSLDRESACGCARGGDVTGDLPQPEQPALSDSDIMEAFYEDKSGGSHWEFDDYVQRVGYGSDGRVEYMALAISTYVGKFLPSSANGPSFVGWLCPSTIQAARDLGR